MTQLSEQVTISLQNAQDDLREALSFASKTEEPRINIAISQLLEYTDNVLKYYQRKNITLQDIMGRHFGSM